MKEFDFMKKAIRIIEVCVLLLFILASITACHQESIINSDNNDNPTNNGTGTVNSDDSIENNTSQANQNQHEHSKNENNNQSKTDEIKYNEACSFIENGKLQEAYEILKEIKNYAPANEKLNNFFYAPTLIKEGGLTSGSDLGPVMQYNDKVYSYDAKGNITSITIPSYNETYNYTYDSKGNELQGFPIVSPYSNGARTCNYKNGKLSKISYSNRSEEYFYNSDGSINKIVNTYQSDYNETPIIQETIYSYTYYDNNTIKTMRYGNDVAVEFQYDTDGDVIKVVMYNDAEVEGYYSIIYGEFGIEKIEVWVSKYSQTEPSGEITYNYGSNGLLTEVMIYDTGELEWVLLLSDYTLCYSENCNARDRIDIISYASIEVFFGISTY